MKNIRLIFFCFIISTIFSCSSKVNKKGLIKPECMTLLQTYSYYWKKDSLGANGARAILAIEVFKGRCDFTGIQWEVMYKILGNPNLIFQDPHSSEVRNRYFLSYFDDANIPGNAQVDIIVVNGIVSKFIVREDEG